MQPTRQAVHSSRISRTPMTRGVPPMSTLKLQPKESISGVIFISLRISFSGSAPRFRSMAIFRPFRPDSSRMSEISRILPCLIRSVTLSMMASVVVV